MDRARRRVIGAAILRALVCWVALFVVFTHVHVVWTWPSQPTPVVKEESVSPDIIPPEHELIVEEDEEEKELEMASQRLWQAKSKADTRLQEWLETTNQKLSLLQHNVHQMESLARQKQPQQDGLQLDGLEKLLSSSSLEYLSEQQLRTAVKEVTDEMKKTLSSEQEIAWKNIFTNYPRDAPRARTCKPSGSVSPDTARESDLFSRVQKVEAALKQRNKKRDSSPLSDESTERVLEAVREIAMETLLAERTAVEADSDDEDEENCVHAEDVDWLVDEGLNAMQRHLDLRTALQEALSILVEDEAPDIILDAILTPPSEPMSGPKRGDSINMRQVLDTPLVSHKSPQWIDAAVDHLSGHNDLLDQTLDSFLGESDEESMGKVLVDKVLNLAGKVNVPNYLQKIDTKAGMLRP